MNCKTDLSIIKTRSFDIITIGTIIAIVIILFTFHEVDFVDNVVRKPYTVLPCNIIIIMQWHLCVILIIKIAPSVSDTHWFRIHISFIRECCTSLRDKYSTVNLSNTVWSSLSHRVCPDQLIPSFLIFFLIFSHTIKNYNKIKLLPYNFFLFTKLVSFRFLNTNYYY